MTITVRISHDTPGSDKFLCINTIATVADGLPHQDSELHPGQSGEFHVHSGQSLLIEEMEMSQCQAARKAAAGAAEAQLRQDNIAEADELEAERLRIERSNEETEAASTDAEPSGDGDIPGGEPAPADQVIETVNYADGSSATGVAPLPDQSPAEQDTAESLSANQGNAETQDTPDTVPE